MTDYKILKAVRNGNEYQLPLDKCCFIDYLVVGGGGGGGDGHSGCARPGGGGGAGMVITGCKENINFDFASVIIGLGGNGGGCQCRGYKGCNGGDTYFGNVKAYGGGGGGGIGCGGTGNDGGNGGGAALSTLSNLCPIYGGKGCAYNGHSGGLSISCGGAGGGGGGGGGREGCPTASGAHGYGGDGIKSSIEGIEKCYAGGGGGGGDGNISIYGGGMGGTNYAYPSSGTTCGSGGGGGSGSATYSLGCKGADGVVIIRYPTDGSYGITNAMGGCKYTCGDYTIHCFTSDGLFIPNYNSSKKYISYLAVGGGGGGSTASGGGGGGEVKLGALEYNNSLSIIIGQGGSQNTNGTSSCIGDIVAKGGCTGLNSGYGGTSGSGCSGGCGSGRGAGGGGGGASGVGGSYYCGGCYSITSYGGKGIKGYGGGGGGYNANYGGGCGVDGGGNGNPYDTITANATGCGGGGGGICCTGYGGGGTGGNGLVEICYPADGSWGITDATGGDCCYTCCGYCVHRFTSDGIFSIVS